MSGRAPAGGVVRIHEPDPARRLARLRQALEAQFRPQRGATYALKPNLSSARPAETGATTDPELVRALVAHLRDHGARARIVELPPHIRNIQRVVRLSGYAALARELELELVLPDRPEEFVDVGRLFGAFPLRVARAAWEAEGIVNLPKVKTHMRAHFSGAVKNLIGLLDMPTRHRIHVFGLHRGIAAMYRALAPRLALNVLDAVVAMEGQGPTRGDPVRLDTLLVGRDALSADLCAARLFGVNLCRVRYLGELAGESPAQSGEPPARRLRPVDNPHPRADYLREALTTQPLLRRLLQRLDFDFISDRRPVLPADGPALDALCPHGAIRGATLLPERCNACHLCLAPGGPLALERGLGHRLRVLRELLGRVTGR